MVTGMVYAQFDNAPDAQAWRKEHGGWLFMVNDSCVLWYCLKFTPSAIVVHHSNAGMDGILC